MKVTITTDPIDSVTLAPTAGGRAGAVVSFTGVVRRANTGRTDVTAVFYDSYREMTRKELERIAAEAEKRFGVIEVTACHRVGEIPVGEASVQIVVASAHRAEAFRACAYVIEEAKRRVPIWKKEHYADGTSRWI